VFDQECETTPMCHALLRDASFWRFLQLIDHDLAEQESAGGCPACGAPLHRADYPRKPRGVPRALFGPDGVRRLSFCCARDGCRRRMTPSSVRFLGRRVFAGAVVVLACALAQGLSERHRQRLCERIGVGLRTLERWRRWWRRDFAASAPWAAIRARLATPVEEQALPRGLLERWGEAFSATSVVGLLRLLAPLSRSVRARG
jgi:hypothetical protein